MVLPNITELYKSSPSTWLSFVFFNDIKKSTSFNFKLVWQRFSTICNNNNKVLTDTQIQKKLELYLLKNLNQEVLCQSLNKALPAYNCIQFSSPGHPGVVTNEQV